ncbi:MAG: hypothetical protein KAS32_23715 [Candidatus Peribacteraceae bacterium]|nr:hypothetical protein [Candidatus Peribacteraceae bacterium]
MTGVTWEYVMSGVSHTRIVQNRARQDDIVEVIQKLLQRMQGRHNHDFSLLFNAHTEAKFGDYFKPYKPHLGSVHADSGGLQIITQGLEIDARMKRAIYDVQGRHSDIAMCFDELPVVLTGDKVTRGDFENRRFDAKGFSTYAKNTADNIQEQIEYFKKKDYKAKPILILQGNGIDWFQEWSDIVLDRIPEELHTGIGGYAVSGNCLGTGISESIERNVFIGVYNAPEHIKHHMHQLGVGAISKQLPLLMLIHSGLIKDVHISYDSTSHSSILNFGKILTDRCSYSQVGRRDNPEVRKLRDYINNLFGDILDSYDISPDNEHFAGMIQEGSEANVKRFGKESKRDWHVMLLATVLAYVDRFTNMMDQLAKDPEYIHQIVTNTKEIQMYMTLDKIKSADDYQYWKRHIGGKIKSARLKHLTDTSNKGIMSFF